MMMGLMLLLAGVAIGFVQAVRVDTDSASAADIAAWVGPLRFAGVALIISGVSLALLTIVEALRFQADRIVQINSELHCSPASEPHGARTARRPLDPGPPLC